MTLNERLFLLADATVHLVAGWVHQAAIGLHLIALRIRLAFLRGFYMLRGLD